MVRSEVYSSRVRNDDEKDNDWTLHSSPLDIVISDTSDMVSAYLALINSSLPHQDDVYLVPVMKDHPDDNDVYTQLLSGAKMFPRIRLITPIVFTITEYTRSDAFQVKGVPQLIL